MSKASPETFEFPKERKVFLFRFLNREKVLSRYKILFLERKPAIYRQLLKMAEPLFQNCFK